MPEKFDLAELKRLHAAATPDEWRIVPQNDGSAMIAREYETGNQMEPKGLRIVGLIMARWNSLPMDEANAELIVALRNAIPAILAMGAECERLRGERDALATALLAAFNAISHYSMHMTKQIAKEHAEALEIARRITG
jgi:hypothetical protein